MSGAAHLEALLRAAKAERPPEGNEARLLVALGVAPGAAPGSPAWRTWIPRGLDVLVAVAVVTGVMAVSARRKASADDPGAIARGYAEMEGSLVVAPVRLPGHAVAEVGRPARRPAVAHGAAAPRVAPPPVADAPSALQSPAVEPFSDDELGYLRDARLALRRGDARAALAALEAHALAFPQGVFRQEAALLRVDALLAAGRGEEARRALEGFEALYPRSPYGARVEGLRRRVAVP